MGNLVVILLLLLPVLASAAQIEPVLDKEIVVVEEPKLIPAGKQEAAVIALPDGTFADFSGEVTVAVHDPQLSVTVKNYVSEDGGKTWRFVGDYTCAAPWKNRDGTPSTRCAGDSGFRGVDKKPVPVAKGALQQSEITFNKPVVAGLSYIVTKEK